MYEYYHLAPVILTDSLFFQYVPTCRYTGTFAQRRSAYTLAEQQMIQHLRTPLIPTTITGTFIWPVPPEPILLPHSHLRSIDRIVVTSLNDGCTCDLTENEACAVIRDGFGLVDARVTAYALTAGCGCASAAGYYYQAIITWTAGLPTGTSAQDPGLHQALAMIAAINLNEVVDPGSNEGGPGDPGVESWGALGYTEKRRAMKSYPFGASPRANYAARLVRHLKKIRPLRFS